MTKINQLFPFNFPIRALKGFQDMFESTQQAFFNTFRTTPDSSEQSFIQKTKPVIEKIKQIAIFILKVSLSTLLYWVNPSLFAIGFIAGIILDDHICEAVQKVKCVWSNQKIAGMVIGGFVCTLSMPVTIATATLLWSAHLGSMMTTNINNLPYTKVANERTNL